MYKTFLKIEKRIRFLISTLVLIVLMLISTLFFFDKAWFFIPIFIISSYALTYFSILEGIERIEWAMLFLMPVLITVSFYLFYFLFPFRWLTRIPFIITYAISIYAMLLTSNIFNVGVEKNLQLYRAAFSVNYFYQTFIMFLISNVVLSLRLNFLLNGLIFFGMIAALAIQLIWTIKLELQIERGTILSGLFIAYVVAQGTVIFSFIPVNISIFALFVTGLYYSLAGLSYAYLDQRLFKETIREYLLVLGFVTLITLLTLSW